MPGVKSEDIIFQGVIIGGVEGEAIPVVGGSVIFDLTIHDHVHFYPCVCT